MNKRIIKKVMGMLKRRGFSSYTSKNLIYILVFNSSEPQGVWKECKTIKEVTGIVFKGE